VDVREDIVTPTTARRLDQEGLVWDAQIGDWCTVLAAAHIGEGLAGMWLVVGGSSASGLLSLVDADGRWPITQVRVGDCLWLPSAGKLKTWLRARGYRVATGETLTPAFASSAPLLRHVCRLTRSGDAAPTDGEGLNEAEAVADATLRVLGSNTADSSRLGW
jgi:hypothetical protein